jgi:hypothetical protein
MSDFTLMSGDIASVATKDKIESWKIVQDYKGTPYDKLAVRNEKTYRVWIDNTGQYRIGRGVVIGYQ